MLAGHPDTRVHGDDAVRADDHRIEVKLGDLGRFAGEPGDAQQGAGLLPMCHGCAVPKAAIC